MSYYWLILFLIACASCTYVQMLEEDKCTTLDCEYLYENFVRHVKDFGGSPCESVHNYVCDKQNFDVKQYVWNEYQYLLNNISRFLSSDSTEYRGDSIEFERKLFKQCMKLGGSESKNIQDELNDTLVFLRNMEIKSSENASWQEIDDRMVAEGFDRAFFDIRVVQDPENLDKNIVMITPPSLTSLFNAFIMFNETFENTKLYDYIKSHTTHPLLISIFGFDRTKPMRSFYSSLFKAAGQYLHRIPRDYEDNQNFRLNLSEWNREFNRNKDYEEKTYINWGVTIERTFKNLGIKVQTSDMVIVKNHPYFNELFQILQKTDNRMIGLAVVMKALSDNLRYINWNFAQLFNYVNKTSFCLNETKLYGISYELLVAFKNGRWQFQVFTLEQSHQILNIVNSLKSMINDSTTLIEKEKDYLFNQLDVITGNILKNISPKNTIFSDFDLFENHNSYFKNINNYRRMLKFRELNTLRLHPELSTKYPPFSVVNLVEPSNRFTLNALFTGGELPKHFIPKHVSYGFYGVRMASLMYALLNENKYHDVSYVYLNRSKIYNFYEYDFDRIPPVFSDLTAALSANPEYHLYKMQCFLSEINHKPVLEKTRNLENTVSDAYGLQVAYNAMIKLDMQESTPFSKQHLNRLTQFFYLAYVKSHCKGREEYTNAAVFNDGNFTENFPMCAQEYNICQIKPFEHIDKNIFLV